MLPAPAATEQRAGKGAAAASALVCGFFEIGRILSLCGIPWRANFVPRAYVRRPAQGGLVRLTGCRLSADQLLPQRHGRSTSCGGGGAVGV
jgi:hypothetical protein